MTSGEKKLIFSAAIESLLSITEGIKPETRQALAALRIGPPHKVEPAYPAEHWAAAVKLVGADLFPDDDAFNQQRKVGSAAVARFSEGLLGKAMFSLARLMGARRSMDRMTRNLRTGANFIETRLTVVDEKTYEFWINDVSDVPGFYAGMLMPGFELIPGWPDTVELKERVGEGGLYLLRHLG